MADQLTSLRDQLVSSTAPIALDAAFIIAGQATPAPGLDAALQKAFRLPQGTGLQVGYNPSTGVQPISGDNFLVTGASVSFLGYPAASSAARLRFRDDGTYIQVLIEAVLSKWKFTTTFPEMTGFPFELLNYDQPTFLFTTEATTWQWSGGATLTLKEAGQHFAGTLTVPDELKDIFAVVKGMVPLPAVTMAGPAVVDGVTILNPPDPNIPPEAPAVLYPQLDLRGTVSGQVEVYVFTAKDPGVGLIVPAPVNINAAEETDELGLVPIHDELGLVPLDDELGLVPLDAEEPDVVNDQTPELFFVATVGVTTVVGSVELELRASVPPTPGMYEFALTVKPDSPVKLTPATAIELVAGGSSSFLSYVPGPLQQLVSRVGLNGATLALTTGPPVTVTSIGMSLGSEKGALPLFSDPTNGEVFQLDAFSIAWMILDPFGKAPHTTLVNVSAEFHIWKSVFSGPFEISVDQDLRIDGRYRDTVSLRKLLPAITANTIQLPAGIEVDFSNFVVQIDPPAKSYSLACTLDASVDFVKYDGKSLIAIEEMELTLAASTPPAAGNGNGRTAYRGGIAGYMRVGPLAADVSVQYDGTASPPVWQLDASLAEPLVLSDVIGQLFSAYNLPDFLPGTITVDAFAIGAEIPTATSTELVATPGGSGSKYEVQGSFTWDLTQEASFTVAAALGLQYDASRNGSKFSGSVVGKVHLTSFGTTVEVGYRFGPAAQDPPALPGPNPALAPAGDSQTIWIAWEGIRGEYQIDAKLLTLSFAGWSAGRVIQTLVRTVGDPYFELESPWDFLNKISLDGLKLIWDFNPGVTDRLSASYTLSSPIELGFLRITGVKFMRKAGQVNLALEGSTTIKSLDGPLFDPTKGQDVKKLPAVPGQGSAYFELLLLMLGQRIAIKNPGQFDSTKAVIDGLKQVPSTTGDTNPVNPDPSADKQPYYDPSSNWLVAAHFGILKVGSTYTFDCMVVFNDPNLYGLRLAASGDKAKVLDGLVLDVLYKKVTDDVGVFQIEFTFPKSLRQIDLGAFAITLPTIGVQIYTNGDFLFDFGFPYKLDFSRSFGLQAIILGVPVLGAAGFYFGRLSIGAAAGLPQSTPGRELVGSFSPAIVFGLGVQLGVGRTFEKGPLRAGFSITVFGIVEGVIAAWHPPTDRALVTTNGGGSLQGDYFFRLQGTFGLIGKLYGSVDFGIVKADVNLTVTLSAQITYESFADIELSASASVSISVSIRINLGIFSFSISFSFAATVTAELTITVGDHNPPWYPPSLAARPTRAERYVELMAGPLDPAAPRTVTKPAQPDTINLHPAPQFTVLSPDEAKPADEQGALVFLIATDTPVANANGNGAGSSFESLCNALLPWVVDAMTNAGGGGDVDLAAAANDLVTKHDLEQFVARLAAHPIGEGDIEAKFLSQAFTVVLAPPTSADRKSALQAGATIFPPFTGLTLTVPAASGSGTATVALADYVKITSGYRANLKTWFGQLAARVEEESGGDSSVAADAAGGDLEPLAQFVFEDWFALVARQLLQAGANAIGDYAYPLTASDSIETIHTWAKSRGNDAVGPREIAAPNVTHPLTAAKPLNVPGVTYTVQQQDTLAAVATRYTDGDAVKRWQVTPVQVAVQNQDLKGLVRNDLDVTFGANSYRTGPGESLATLAAGLKTTVPLLAADAGIQARTDLLAPTTVVSIPTFVYTTAADDTLQSIQQQFDVSLDALVADPGNYALTGLFDPAAKGPGLRIAGLDKLRVADVWDALERTDEVAQVAGMVARFQLHGMRLPVQAGLELPASGFLYPTTGQTEYGLYQLTGQQFPAPAITPGDAYSMTLAKDPATLGWLQLPTPTVDMTEQARELYYVVQYAQANVFQPAGLTLAPEPAVIARSKRWGLASSTPWSSSDESEIASLADPSSTVRQQPSGPQVTPIVWDLPSALLSSVADRQRALTRLGLSTEAALPYLPLLAPQLATSDPASGHTKVSAVDGWAFATRIQFEVKRLPQTDDLAPPTPQQNSAIPPGPGNQGAPPALAPFNYELVGPGPADAVLLERLLTAADTLGKDLLAHVFLMYPDAGPGSPGLTSRADAEFLSFITRTNLSTETNPVGYQVLADEAPEQPTGIARPDEFVRLMWELSTVRSGGYYLHYEVLKDGTGLPDTLFDSSGAAQLTLLIAYDRSLSAGTRVMDYVNALVTTESIDTSRSVMTVKSQPAPERSQPLAPGETLADISAVYGTDVGELARLNATAAFAGTPQIPLAGIVHQVTQADVATGDALNAVAAYYSRGAQTPITKVALAGYNPDVSAGLGAALRIPAFVAMPTGAGGAPGPSFQSLSDYYGLSYDELGYAARLVPGLYPAGTITVDSHERDTNPGTGTGNAGVALSRSALPDPCPPPPPPPAPVPPCPPINATPAQAEPFASAYMQTLYTMLTASIVPTPFFSVSPAGLPFGPRKPHTDEDAHELRDPELRRATLAAAAGDPLEYEQAVGYGAFASINPAPAGDADGPLPLRAANPYAGVGTPIQLDLRWVDIFGNRIVSAFEQPPPGYTGPLDDLPLPLRYSDRIVGLGQWPNVRADYLYSGAAGSPELSLRLNLEVAAYDSATENWQQTAANDRKTFTTVYFQLNQDYDDIPDPVPGLTGQAISMSLENTLLQQPRVELSDAQEDQVRTFVADCLTYVWKRAHGKPGGAAPTATVSMSVAPADVAATDVIPMSLRFTLTRQAELTEPALCDVAGGLSDTTEVMPRTSDPAGAPGGASTDPPPVSVDQFARDAEAAFVTADWQLRIGTTASPPGTTGIGGQSLWAVRMAAKAGAGLGYTITPGASFYAPQPLAVALRDGPAKIGSYTTKDGFVPDAETLSFAGVDMNAWAQHALAAIDALLTPTYTSPAFIVDELLVSEDPASNGWLAKILDHKETLAAAIARTVKPALDASLTDDDSRRAAEDKLYQALLNQLSAAYTVTAVTVFSATGAAVREKPAPGVVSPPRFYGQPLGTNAAQEEDDETGQTNFALSTGKVPLTPFGSDGSTRLAFLFSSKTVTEQAFVPLELTYAMTHLEHDIRNVPGIDGYEQSQWIKFLTGPFEAALPAASGAIVNVPVVLRALPQPPSLTGQDATKTYPDLDGRPLALPAESPDQLARWDYAFSYLYRGAAQDTVSATVEFNRGPAGVGGGSGDPSDDLFSALAQFVTLEPLIAADIETYLRPVIGTSKASDDGVLAAGRALAAFEAIVAAVATTYDAWSKWSPGVSGAPAADHVVHEFEIGLRQATGDHARVVIYAAEGEIPPAPLVDFDPTKYVRHEVPVDPSEAAEDGGVAPRVAYEYEVKDSKPTQWLLYEDALALPARTVSYENLDVFARQDGYSTIYVERNLHLAPDAATTDWFVFRTPEVKFADRLVPLLAYADYDLGSVDPVGTSLEKYLADFFDSLLSSAEGQQVAVKMSSGYEFNVVPGAMGMSATVLPIHLLPPTVTMPGSPAFVPVVAKAVSDWLSGYARPSDQDAAITFGLEVFAGDAVEQKPLLTVSNLHVAVANLAAS